MAGTYKTPGVYVEEITKFPPSVAEVDTAIPAFVGYTEKAKRFVEDDLLNIPSRIKSLPEYELYFGTGPSYDSIHVQLTTTKVVDTEKTTVANSIYNLYESMRLFFDNGGGVCYVCAVGKYKDGHDDNTRATKLTAGLDKLRQFDEPTILLFPDAVNIKTGGVVDWNKIAGIQQAALKQCGDLGDRFAVLDVPDESTKNVLEEADTFRSKVGMNNLKYGAAYMPFVKTIYDKTFRLKDIDKNLFDSASSSINLKTLFSDSTSDTVIKTKLDKFKQLYSDNDNLATQFAAFTGKTPFDINDLESSFQTFSNAYKSVAENATGDPARLTALKNAFNFVFVSYLQLEGLVTDLSADTAVKTRVVTNDDLKNAIKAVLGTNLKTSLQTFRNLDSEAYYPVPPPTPPPTAEISSTAADQPATDFTLFTEPSWAPGAAANDNLISGADLKAKGTAAFSVLSAVFQSMKTTLASILSSGLATEEALEKALLTDIPIYNSIVSVLNTAVNTLPPSGAVAGIYAAVDRDRGVWKAPANVTINSVSDVSELIDDSTQEGLNVDPNAGKSVNAIRAFYGKGIIVWGARTLAGNDNEWRYVPVRRLFSFVEESCKKSTSWCVFEPNDANTWARIRSQIDNFLNNIWRRGALAGAKPEHAYYVNCGIGITMTAQDILEGRLIIEIGMAAVRPAEFVILKFSHKLQQS